MASNPLPPLWKFDFGDYSALGAVFQKFLSNLNLFTLSAYNILNGGIGFANLQRAIYKIQVTAGTTTPISFVNPLTIVPSGVSVCQAQLVGDNQSALTDAVSAANFYYDGKNINILNVTGLTSGKVYNLALEVF